jgi:acetyl-CoA carboxylase biotin carboxyl carrier protein
VVRGGQPAAPARRAEPDVIAAPMQGTFYRAEAPGREPFVDVGSQVEPDTVVCIVEIMKMMNSVPAGMAGTIVEVCAEDAQLVGEGEALFRVQ